MKLRHSVKWMLVGVLSMPALTACSFGGGDEEAEEVEASEEGNAANADNAEGNEAVAVEGAENAAGADGNVAFDDANSGNAAAGDGGVASNDIPPELLNSENPTALSGAENAAMGNKTAAAEEMPANASSEPAPTDALPASSVAEAVAPVAPQVASSDSRVYYVSVDSASLHNGPSASAQTVGSLSKGDPVLVKIEGAWANILNRGYVEVASLSQTPVGRSASGAKAWQ